MATRVSWTVDTKAANKRLDGMAKRSQDFTMVFRKARLDLQRANMENFASRGARSGAPWSPLDSEYHRWKLAHYGPRPLMVKDGELSASLFSLHGPPNLITPREATFGTSVRYAGYHQFGTSRMPRRKIVFVPPEFPEGVGRDAAEHIVNGMTPGAVGAARSVT